MTEATATRHTDIAVVGGGLAGSTAAAMLARAGHDFVLIDPDVTYPWDFRCEKLEEYQVDVLRQTGLADVVLPVTTPIERLWVARLGRFSRPYTNHQFGFHYDQLVNRFRAQVPLDHFMKGKVASIAASGDRQTLVLSSGQEVSARLIVLATGPNHSLRKSLGIERNVTSPCHSVTLGFDVAPVGRPKFDFESLTYFPERSSEPISCLTLFPVRSDMRANLFVYRQARDPWFGKFREAPVATCLAAMPGLSRFLGEFEITGDLQIRPADLYETTGYRRPGIVLVGDAFASSCPAAGTGAGKVFVDVVRLCNVHIPNWLATAGMSAEKISAFYDDPEKRASDEHSKEKAFRLRAATIDRNLRWHVRRVLKSTTTATLAGFDRALSTLRGAKRQPHTGTTPQPTPPPSLSR